MLMPLCELPGLRVPLYEPPGLHMPLSESPGMCMPRQNCRDCLHLFRIAGNAYASFGFFIPNSLRNSPCKLFGAFHTTMFIANAPSSPSPTAGAAAPNQQKRRHEQQQPYGEYRRDEYPCAERNRADSQQNRPAFPAHPPRLLSASGYNSISAPARPGSGNLRKSPPSLRDTSPARRGRQGTLSGSTKKPPPCQRGR